MFDLRDSFETTDGSRPDATELSEQVAKAHPLAAFTVLSGGDAFDAGNRKPPPGGIDRAGAYLEGKVEIRLNGAEPAIADRVRADMVRQLLANPALIARLEAARPIVVDIVPEGQRFAQHGFPKRTAPNVSGLFWDNPKWDRARIGLRADRLDTEKALVFHEFGHAVHYLAFTKAERDLIYKVLRPVFGSRAAMDEVFAIYTERELLGAAFGAEQKRAPGVYGFTRKQWDETHLFTRFVRKLYFPHKALAGQKELPGARAWQKFSGG